MSYEMLSPLVGLLADRPVANDPQVRPNNNSGVAYITTDTHQHFISDGATWHELGGGGTSLPGVTSDGQDGATVAQGLRARRLTGLITDSLNVNATLIEAAETLTTPIIASVAADHAGAIGGNDGRFSVSMTGGFAPTILQRVPLGVTMTDLSVLTLAVTLGSGVSLADAQDTSIDVFFLPDDGAGNPDTGASPITLNTFGSTFLAPGLRFTRLYWRTPGNEVTIDHSYWLCISPYLNDFSSSYGQFLSLDAADGSSVTTVYGVFADGVTTYTPGTGEQIYAAFAHDQGLQFFSGIGNLMALLAESGLALTHMLGENGKTPPASPVSITGNVTTGDLAALQAVVGQLLTALDAKGSITKSTT